MQLFDIITPHEKCIYRKLKDSSDEEIKTFRMLLQEMFENYPDSHKESLRTRFSDKKDDKHYAAFFELFTHQWLLEMGFQLECLDDDSNVRKTPDFLVLRDSIPQFYLECTLCADSKIVVNNKFKQTQIRELIETLQPKLPDVSFHLRFSNMNSANITKDEKRDLLSFIQSKYQECKQNDKVDEENKEYLNRWHFRSQNLAFTIIVNDEVSGQNLVRSWSPNSHGHNGAEDRKKLQKDIKSKYNKFQNLEHDIPCVVALNMVRNHDIGDIEPNDFSLKTALLGDYSINMDDGIGGHSLSNSGFFCGDRSPKNTAISAVIIWKSLVPTTFLRRTPVIFHHPFCTKPLREDLIIANYWSYGAESEDYKLSRINRPA